MGVCYLARDYKKAAQQARLWLADETLSLPCRLVAQNLAELAELLCDARFGCPTEYLAAAVMYCHLCKADPGLCAAEALICPGEFDCPKTARKA